MATQRKFSYGDGVKYVYDVLYVDAKQYLDWCARSGMEPTFSKTRSQLSKEVAAYKADLAHAMLDKSNRNTGDERKMLQAIMENPTQVRDLPGDWGLVGHIISRFDDQTKGAFLRLAESIAEDSRSKILKDREAVKTLAHMAEWHMYWVGDPASWKAKSHSLRRQMASIVRHLFAKYPVPEFLDKAWEDSSPEMHREWYVHVAQGGNIRTARMLPFPLTKKMAHHFLEAPADFSIYEGLLHGQVLALGGDERISRGIRGSMIDRFDDEFRQSFIKFLVAHSMLDTQHYAPIIDYILHVKYTERDEFDQNGVRVNRPPPQPNFSMAGRSVETLMGQVERWHRELNKAQGNKEHTSWKHVQTKDFTLKEGEESSGGHKTWTIVQLLNSKELFDEGRAMKHCVASYSGSCSAGRCSIWSLRMYTKEGGFRCVTIEMDKANQIIQVRGPRERYATPQEGRIIQLWAAKNNLSVASYVFSR